MQKYRFNEKIRLLIPKWVWALGTFVYMIGFYIGMPIMALYGLYKLISKG